VSTADSALAVPVSVAEGNALFTSLASTKALVLAVSGGPDSTALLVLAARWRAALRQGPDLLAVTVDHRLRAASAREAHAVKRVAARLGVRHRTLSWTGRKPATGLQEAARAVRYRLLAAAARGAGAAHVLTGHTLDDQAETVLLRMARGSGPSGLCAMATVTPLEDVALVRPLLDLPKARLVATLEAIGMSFVHDPSNVDPRFTRARLRALMPALAAEGLDAPRLGLLARRLRRAEAAIEMAVDAAARSASHPASTGDGRIVLDAQEFSGLPAEVALRLLGRAIAACGDEGPVQLGKLESLGEALIAAVRGPRLSRIRRTLAGALITLAADRLVIERAPPRSFRNRTRSTNLTTKKLVQRSASKRR
jgi:tRNA(Ile)-lysidine synthase